MSIFFYFGGKIVASNTKKEINILLRTDMDIGNAAKEADKLRQVFSKISLPAENETKINKLFNNLNDEIVKYQNKLKSGFKTKTDVTGLENTGKNINRIFEQINSEFGKVQKMDLGEIFKIDPKVQEEINKINQEIEKYRKNLSELGKKNNLPDLINFQNQLKTKGAKDNSKKVFDLIDEGEYQKALELIQKLQNEYSKLVVQYQTQGKNTANVEANAKAFDDLGNSVKGVISQAGELNQKINNLEVQKTDKITQELTNVQTSINGAADGFNRLTNETKGYISVGNAAANETQQLNKELSDVQNKVAYFFSLTNSVNLLKRSIRSAYNTVKELDAAMTETAVVTDFSVNDMWDQLPRYTKAANELGTTTLGAYQTMTLFYQQGLKTNEVFEIGTETMKMARIANMDYADATDKMTAALRGFNMELNETSAQRVNNVYSELAAITAADTNEIATAMTKTASIADSANMEFETTAAFLSQIVETTRESAETAGTAMKTVIARFQELKKDPAEIGEVDGEIVDANKIETALRTINVALRDTSGQFRDLDDVFLEIASKWNTLDTNTQRYIATMAAGSRQQSRFIAMMSNYDRTMELVNAANNSAGASQRQFEKTTESLESKLNKLKNAWDAFTMGLTNSEIIKYGVDLLTNFLTTVNKLIDGISGGNGLIKSILSLGIAFGGLKIGKNLITGLSSDVAKVFKNAGKEGASAWNDGLKAGFKASGKSIQKTVKNIFNKDFWSSSFKGIFESDKPFDDLLKNINTDVLKADIDIAKELGDFEEVSRLKTELAKSEEYYNKILNTSQSQQIAYNAAVRAGIPLDQAESILTAKQSKEELALALARKAGKTAADDETRAQAGLIIAEQTHLQFLKMGLLQKAKYIGTALFSTGQKKAEAIATLGLAKAEGTAYVATNALGKAMLALPIGWVVAGLALVAGAFYAIWKASPAQQFKEAQEAAEQAANAADNLAEKYNNLKTSLDEIEEKKSNLDKLTKGTQEWNDAVFELNQQILDLMKNYPELVNFISPSEDGILTIDYNTSFEGKTANDVINKAYESQLTAAAASITAEINVLKAENENTISKFIGGLNTSETRRAIEQLAIAVSKGEIRPDINNAPNDIKNFLLAQGLNEKQAISFSDRISDNIDGLITLSNQLYNTSKQIETYNNTIASQAHQLADLSGYSDDIVKASLNFSINNNEQTEDRLYKDYLNNLNKHSKTNDDSLLELFASEYGYTYAGAGFKGFKFKDNQGNIAEELSAKEIATRLAAINSVKELVEKEEKFAKALQASESDIKKFAEGTTNRNLLNKDLKDEFIKAMDGVLNEDAAAEYFDKLYNEQKTLFTQAENILFGNNEQGRAGVLNKESADEKAIENRLGATALSGLADNLYNVLVTQGKEAANKLYDEINKITNSMDDETAQKFVAALNGINWSSQSSIESFKNQLKEFGVSLPEEEVEDFIENMKDTTKAIDELTFEQLQEKLLGLKDVIDNVTSKIEDDIAIFTQEEMDSILATGAADRDDFIFSDIDEYTFIGDTESLLTSINGNVAEILGIQKGQLEDKVKKGEKIAEIVEGEYDYNYFDSEGNTQTENIGSLYQKIINNKDFADSISTGSLEILAGNIGAISWDEAAKDIYGHQELIDKIKEYYNEYYLTLIGNKELLEEEKQSAEEYDLYHTDAQYQTQQLKGKKITTAEDTDGEQLVEVLRAQAINYGVTTSKIEEFNKALEANDGKLDDATAAILANAIAEKNAEKAYAKTSEEIREVTDDYEDLKDITEEDTQLIGEALGLTDLEVGSENFNFVKENLDLIAQAAEGDIKAFSDLQDKLAEHYGLTINAETGNIDLSGLVNAQQDVENAAIAALNALLAAGSYEIESVTVQQGGYYDIPIINENTGLITGFETKEYKAGETYQVIKPIDAPSVKRATNNTSGKSSRKSSGGSKSKDWENPYDKFYNLTETINKNLREREKLERTYNKLLREQQHILNTIDYEKNLSDQISNLRQQADKLRREYALQSTMYSGKGNELQSYMARNSSMHKYGYYDAASQQIVIDWDTINKVKNDEKGQKIEDYIGKLEELRDAMWDAEDAMLDAEEQIEEMKEDLHEKLEELRQAYLDFEDRIVEALVAQRQAEIDELQEVYDLMSESNNSVLSAIQEVISEQRRLRELEEQKADIEEMQRRLAMLRQDTSGASDLEIKALEEQIGDAQQSYTDSLIDQAIDEMGTANEKAEEQRQQQIDLLQHQLDWDKENGKFWTQVNELLSTAINPDGSLNNNSPLVELLKNTEGYKAMSEFGKQNWWTNLQKTVAEAMAGLKEWLNPTDVDTEIGGIQGGDAGIVGGIGSDNNSSNGNGSGEGKGVVARGENVKVLQRFLKNYWGKNVDDDGLYGSKTKKAVKEVQKTLNDSGAVAGGRIQEDGLYGADTQNAIRLFYSRTGRSNISIPAPMFKTGGLADFTGPAWLDGTKTHPEIVLNARDTANFLELRDILRDMNLLSEEKTSGGDNYFEIHIEVDTLSNDYDVEQVADKVKRIINDDARYRNTNAINLIR